MPDWLGGLCFDTASANTGYHSSAITVIQQAFDKRLQVLACRHHIYEAVATRVLYLFLVSSGLHIPISGRFKDHWSLIDQSNFAPISKDTTGFACHQH